MEGDGILKAEVMSHVTQTHATMTSLFSELDGYSRDSPSEQRLWIHQTFALQMHEMESETVSSGLRFHLFNSDRTYSMDRVVDLLDSVKGELPFSFTVEQHPFPLSRMKDLSEEVSSFDMDYAVFVVHANESRLSINEENAGIGYAVLFKALLRATGLNPLSTHFQFLHISTVD